MIRHEIRQGEFVYMAEVTGPDGDGTYWKQIRRRRVESIGDDKLRLSAVEQVRFPADHPPGDLEWEPMAGLFSFASTVTREKFKAMNYKTSTPIKTRRAQR